MPLLIYAIIFDMTTNAIVASRNFATKADIAELKGEIKTLGAQVTTQIKTLTGLVIGLYVGIALIFLTQLAL